MESKNKYAGSADKLWRINASKATWNGPRSSIAFVRKNPNFAESVIQGKPEHEFISGNVYRGDWSKNKRQGFGTQSFPNGNKYEGDWAKNKRHGKGTMWIKDGTKLRKQYTGDWIEGLRHGLGIYYYKNGNKYEGQWRRGQRHGRGKLVYANGDVYEGDWLEGKRSGLGVLSYSNGDRFEGHWHLDKKEGPGRYLYYNTSKMYEGEWAEDIAKCGVYSDITPEMFGSGISKADFLAARTADAFDLPALHLADAEKTVGDAMAAVRKRRAAERGQRALEVSEGVFTVDEIRQLREAFRVVDVCNEGTIPGHGLVNVLEALGMQPNEEDVEALLAELGAESSGSVSFAEFAGVLARLKV